MSPVNAIAIRLGAGSVVLVVLVVLVVVLGGGTIRRDGRSVVGSPNRGRPRPASAVSGRCRASTSTRRVGGRSPPAPRPASVGRSRAHAAVDRGDEGEHDDRSSGHPSSLAHPTDPKSLP